jgi:hypothetical protein
MNRFIFFNGLHVGDIVINKPFIKEIMKQIPDHDFYISHYNNEFITNDLCPFISPVEIQIPRNDEFITKYDHTTIMNTWFSAISNNDKYAIKVLLVSVNTFDLCLFEQQIDIYNQLLKPLGIDISYMGNHPEDYIWEIENKYINNNLLIKEEGFKVLIYTNKSLSGQTDKSDQTNYINEITDKYSEITFFVTDGSINKSNVICLNNFFTKKGLDLFQFAELSKKCNIITGNSNGAIMFSWLKSNLLNKSKTYVIQHRNNCGECQFTSKQLNKTIHTRSTREMFDNLDLELSTTIQKGSK